MKKWIGLLLFCGIGHAALAQISAITNKGDQVLLNADGTWKYVSKTEEAEYSIPESKVVYTKPKASEFKVNSNVVEGLGVYLNPKEWTFKKSETGEAAEYNFDLKDKDAYGMLISERIEIPIENLMNIAIDNARSAAPDIKVVSREYRMVNGLKVLCMQMDGTIQGIAFSYFGYYYSSPKGTVQFLTYTSSSLLKDYRAKMEELLNGLSVSTK